MSIAAVAARTFRRATFCTGFALHLAVWALLAAGEAAAGSSPPASAEGPISALPYAPSLDLTSMTPGATPAAACTDFYTYICGGWQQRNPIPPDQAAWSVYAKLGDDNNRLLWGILEAASRGGAGRSPAEQKIGDYFHSCMDAADLEKAGLKPMQPQLAAVNALHKIAELPALLAKLQLTMQDYDRLLFSWTSAQDFANAADVIGALDAGGLGLPDRDYYVKTDAKSVATRQLYQAHIAKMLTLAGAATAPAKADAVAILQLETALAKASLTRVERRDPYHLYHKMTMKELQALTPNFDWKAFFTASGAPPVAVVNVAEPKFFQALATLLQTTPIATWQAYLRWHLLHNKAPNLTAALSAEDFAFYRRHLRGVEVEKPRWKRCVAATDRDLGEALGQVYTAKTFTPELKAKTLAMTEQIEAAMQREIGGLPWMETSTKTSALTKLHALVNKIGYPDHWRDYSAVAIKPDDYFGNAERASVFETRRQLAKIGKPVDHSEWMMTPPTVNAYYDAQMNDINFPAGVLQPPLYDAKMDDAPNYGNTGSTIGHELTHAFDDQGRQYDAKGNLRDWWTKKDAAAFDQRSACIIKQYGQYTIVDDIKINSQLTIGEDIADLGGVLLAYQAWQQETAGKKLPAMDGLSPDQRFFIGMGQWACENERPDNLRASSVTNPHSPGRYRVNGVVANMPEFAAAFSCKAGQPMVRANPCKIW